MRKGLVVLLLLVCAAHLSAVTRAVVFDFGGVLSEFGRVGSGEGKRALIRCFLQDSLHLSKEDLEKASQERRRVVQEVPSDEIFWSSYAKTIGVTLPLWWGPAFRGVMHESLELIQPMWLIVSQLRKNGLVVGMLSNVDARCAHILDSFGLYEPFDPCLLSYAIGLEKPDLRIYQCLLSELGLPAGEVVFIDDRIENVKAARQLGIDALLFESAEQVRFELCQRGLL